MKRIVAVITLCLLACVTNIVNGQKPAPAEGKGNLRLTLPNKSDSVRFLVFGDNGTGLTGSYELAELMFRYHSVFPYDFALMLGDNLYGGEKAEDYDDKFARPYKKLLDAGVKFYATLGNHDSSNQRFYKHFNMDGKEYYSVKKGDIRFLSLNSNYPDARQLKWLEDELKADAKWKICFFHHPLYSSGRQHGSNEELQKVLEPLFVKYKVNVVLNGHEHFYERIKPQKGVYYFISGAGGKLRPGDVKKTLLTEKSFDQALNFMLIEINGDQFHFQVVSNDGRPVDQGVLTRQP